MNGEATRFRKGNKAAEKWTIEEARNALEEAFLNAFKSNDVLCVQDAFFSIDMRPTTAHYLINKFPELEDIKKDINDVVICRVNKGALEGDYNPTAGIWRMKQLGEKDQQFKDHTTGGDKINTAPDLAKLSTDTLRKVEEEMNGKSNS
jgi:hypothetical protein